MRSPPFHLAVGGLEIIAVDEDETEAAGWPYATTTIGSDAYSVTGFIGVGSSTSVFESDFNGKMLLQFGGEVRLDDNIRPLVETLCMGKGSETLGGGGVRYFRGRVALEVGVAFVLSDAGGLLPWAALAWSF